MRESSPVTIARKNYQPPNWTIDKTELEFELTPALTVVQSKLHLRRVSTGPLQLDGSDLELQSVSVDGLPLDKSQYKVSAEHLVIDALPERCELTIVVQVQWHDPHPKPCYLFALVAGKLSRIKDTFTTRSNRVVDLHIYVEEHNIDQCQFAMDALKRSMKWDEQVYSLEYDLDLFMIVAVDDFNAGAMENKGLNIFNSKYVLADASLATDNDFLGVEAVVAHEYFHNWTGNRVTCRDWFQLSLKEGLTVFRDQQFSADMQSRDVKRIEDVRLLRAQQFAEDASPMSHPIRPDEYIEVNNFYTLTVYEKGAEVIRMIHTLLGPERYHAGIDLYFERHDGQAVTCDDFVQAMQDAGGMDLTHFRQWYSQSGTPRVIVHDSYNAQNRQYKLTVAQCNPDRSGALRPPLHIPLRIGLLDSDARLCIRQH